MLWNICLILVISSVSSPQKHSVFGGGAPGDSIVITNVGDSSNRLSSHHPSHDLPQHHQQLHHQAAQSAQIHHQQHHQHAYHTSGSNGGQASSSQLSAISTTAPGAVAGGGSAGGSHAASSYVHHHAAPGSGHIDHRHSYNLLSEAMSHAVSNEFHSLGSGSADGACHADDFDCYSGNIQDRLGMEAIRTLHRQLDDDDNGNIDLSESDDFLREELKYDSGYEKRQKAFHFNDDMHISVKELWEAWLRSEVHNWTIEQTTDWLAQSVQLPQYVDLFKLHKVTGAALPRLAVNNMHYVSNVLGIKDPIHKQKIALKAMDVVLFGPPRETGTRWKDYILVTLLLSAIIGCWYAYQQNKNAKKHLRRMAQDMEGLQRAEQSLQEMQKELERARMEQENVATEKMDLERRLKEAPSLSSSSSDLEVQQLKKEIEMLRTELSRAEIELVDNCWAPPPQLQSWLQYTYELESKNHLKKRIAAEKQLQLAREACEKLRKKRSSLVGAFVSTHGKSIDDVDRSIVEARNSLGEVTNELQERLHRWKQIETCLGFNIVNNNGLAYLENVLYGRNGTGKGSRGRMTSSTDDLDDESVQVKSSDPKALIWCQWKSTRSSPGNNSNNSNSSSNTKIRSGITEKIPQHDTVLPASNVCPLSQPFHHQQQQLSRNSSSNSSNISLTSISEQQMTITDLRSTTSQQQAQQLVATKSRSSTPPTTPQHHSLQNHPPTRCNSNNSINNTSRFSLNNRQSLVRRPPPPNQRPLLRRHTVIPKWMIPIQPIHQASTMNLRRDDEKCVSHSERSPTRTNLHSSHSAGCLDAATNYDAMATLATINSIRSGNTNNSSTKQNSNESISSITRRQSVQSTASSCSSNSINRPLNTRASDDDASVLNGDVSDATSPPQQTTFQNNDT